jgi:ceramide glucosyltransferase
MASTISSLMLWIAAFGIALVGLQTALAVAHVRRAAPSPTAFPGISILKPLCGVDDALMANLQSFAELKYPRYEVLLGVKDVRDPAYEVACQAAARWPSAMRVVLQVSAPGYNPKVNQLITLSRRARFDLLVISDSNVRVGGDYLAEIAAQLEDSRVGLVTHAIAGIGERGWGALFDNLHLTSAIGPSMIAANRVGQALAVGKSMAFRRSELTAIGGFEAFKDVLAEDFVMGRKIARLCGKRVIVARQPIMNVTCRRSVLAFMQRYTRWSIMQRKIAGNGLYSAQLAHHPLPLALGAFLIDPDRHALAALLMCGASKIALDCYAYSRMRGAPAGARHMLAIPLKDLLLLGVWTAGLLKAEVQWRGTRMVVLEGSRLAPSAPEDAWQAQVS